MTLSALTEEDLETVLTWRSASAVLHRMYNHDETTSSEHRAWFQRLQNDAASSWYLYRCGPSAPAGVVCFTRRDLEQRSAFWSFYTSPHAVPGTSIRLALDSLELGFSDLSLAKVCAEVLETNSRSFTFHKKIGFVEEGTLREQYFDGVCYVDVSRFGMLAREWPDRRRALVARIAELNNARVAIAPAPAAIVILSDEDSWINPAIYDLMIDWTELGHRVHWTHRQEDLPPADFCFLLSFSQVVPSEVTAQFRHTLVVHESELPQGKGWSPLSWQVIDGRRRIPVTLFEAVDRVDSGRIYAQRWIEFEGHELVDELRAVQAKATLSLCRWFVERYPESAAQAREQIGVESFYARRGPADSELDPEKSIADQFNLLRVVDNERYPAYFTWHGYQYQLIVSRKSG